MRCSDSLNTLKMIAIVDQNYHRHGNDIADQIQMHRVVRETNFCADFLTKLESRDLISYADVDAPLHAM